MCRSDRFGTKKCREDTFEIVAVTVFGRFCDRAGRATRLAFEGVAATITKKSVAATTKVWARTLWPSTLPVLYLRSRIRFTVAV